MEAPDGLRDLFRWRAGEGVVAEQLRAAMAFPDELGEIVKTPAWGIWTFPLLEPSFCKSLIWFSDVVGRYNPEAGDPYPGRELNLKLVQPLFDVVQLAFSTYVAPLVDLCYDGFKVDAIAHAFVLRYSADTQRSMGLHFDAMGDVSLTVALNEGFEGGGLNFPRYEWDTRELRAGDAVMFPSKVTHRHEGTAVESGERYVLVLWLKGVP